MEREMVSCKNGKFWGKCLHRQVEDKIVLKLNFLLRILRRFCTGETLFLPFSQGGTFSR